MKLNLVTAKQNQSVKFLRKLDQKKYREKYGQFLMEGPRGVMAAVESGHVPSSVYFSETFYNSPPAEFSDLPAKLGSTAKRTVLFTDELMEYACPGKTSQGVAAVFDIPVYKREDILKRGGYYIALHKIADPGNLGAIIRSAAAFGCGAIMLAGPCTDPFNPKTVRSTAGYILDVPVIKFDNENELLEFCKSNTLKIYGFSSHAKEDASILKTLSAEEKKRTAFLFGEEAHGLEQERIRNIKTLRIPMKEQVESLNLSVSASIVMSSVFS